jgi:hypothetical protein
MGRKRGDLEGVLDGFSLNLIIGLPSFPIVAKRQNAYRF